jgi:DNA-binding GntR family transcriptional regulator
MPDSADGLNHIINNVKKRRVTTKELVTDAIREAIIKGYIKNGEEIKTNVLTEKFGVSRMPIRLALQQLETEGLVHIEPHKKAVAVKLSPDEIKKITEIRCELEGLAIRSAMPNLTKDVFNELLLLLDDMKSCTESEEYMILNMKFHDTIYKYSYNSTLRKLINQLRNIVERYLFILEQHHFKQADKDHAQIYYSLVKFDTKQAEEHTRAHLIKTRDAIINLLENLE